MLSLALSKPADPDFFTYSIGEIFQTSFGDGSCLLGYYAGRTGDSAKIAFVNAPSHLYFEQRAGPVGDTRLLTINETFLCSKKNVLKLIDILPRGCPVEVTFNKKIKLVGFLGEAAKKKKRPLNLAHEINKDGEIIGKWLSFDFFENRRYFEQTPLCPTHKYITSISTLF